MATLVGSKTKTKTPDRFSAPVAAGLAGISYRQIDHWDRTGVLVPSVCQPEGSGTSRVYNAEDVLVLAVLRELSRMGVRLIQLGLGTDVIRRAIRRRDRFLVVNPVGDVESCGERTLAVALGAHGSVAAWVLDVAAITAAVSVAV